jgi:hypothetical protein
VGIEYIHIFQTKPFQALIQTGQHIFPGSPFAIRPLPHIIARFGRNDQLIPICGKVLLQDPAEILLGGSGRRTIIVGQIKMGNAQVKCPVYHCPAVFQSVNTAEIVP